MMGIRANEKCLGTGEEEFPIKGDEMEWTTSLSLSFSLKVLNVLSYKMLLIPVLALIAVTAVNGQNRQNELPQPFRFAYRNVHEYGGGSFHESTGDGSGRVSGSYGLTDPDGRNRLVVYVADELGYRATVTSNEPGLDDSQGSPANVELRLGNGANIGQPRPIAVQPPRRVIVSPQTRPVVVRPQPVQVRPSGAYRVVSVPRTTGGYRVIESPQPQVDYVYVRPGSPYYP